MNRGDAEDAEKNKKKLRVLLVSAVKNLEEV